MTSLPRFADVLAAAERLQGVAHRTPVLTSSRIDAALGLRVYFKAEFLQRAGAFKFRGAYNALSRLAPDQRARGVVAYSSGNHAQAIALAARLLDVPATIVMPSDAPSVKRRATAGYGATIVTYDRDTEDRERIGADLAARDGLALIPPYDHPDIVAGQGTAALELVTSVPDLDAILVPLGGGGLLSGTLLAAADRAPHARVYGVEPAAGDDGLRSLREGRIVHIDPPRTIADGARTQHLGRITFPIISERVTDVLTATDDDLVAAMSTLAATMKIVVELILSGGNVDLARFAEYLARAAT
jgi:threonine dehydratase